MKEISNSMKKKFKEELRANDERDLKRQQIIKEEKAKTE